MGKTAPITTDTVVSDTTRILLRFHASSNKHTNYKSRPFERSTSSIRGFNPTMRTLSTSQIIRQNSLPTHFTHRIRIHSSPNRDPNPHEPAPVHPNAKHEQTDNLFDPYPSCAGGRRVKDPDRPIGGSIMDRQI